MITEHMNLVLFFSGEIILVCFSVYGFKVMINQYSLTSLSEGILLHST